MENFKITFHHDFLVCVHTTQGKQHQGIIANTEWENMYMVCTPVGF